MRPPSRRQWPKSLIAAARQRRGLYAKLDTLRVLAPDVLCFLIENWGRTQATRLLEELDANSYWEFEQLIKSGNSVINTPVRRTGRRVTPKDAHRE